jgi:hypothetical protein
MFTLPLPCNGRLFLFCCSDFQLSCHIVYCTKNVNFQMMIASQCTKENISRNTKFEVLTAVKKRKSTVFGDSLLHSLVKVCLCFGGTYRVSVKDWAKQQLEHSSSMAHSSALKIEAVCAFRTLIVFHHPTQHNISQDSHFHFQKYKWSTSWFMCTVFCFILGIYKSYWQQWFF